MPELLLDPAALRERLGDLLASWQIGELDGGGEALVECFFRLAVHPATPVAEALDLLQRALRSDGANPRYSYHLARLHFLHDQLEPAGRWLQKAHQLCPTSHRIWAHVSLLQKELDARYRRDERFEPNALRARGAALADRIVRGEDEAAGTLLDLKPPPSRARLEAQARQREGAAAPWRDGEEISPPLQEPPPATRARRVLDPGRCRWSGIHDLLAEELLEGSPSDESLRKLKPLLAEVALGAGERPGGMAALAILGIQWLVTGYPAAPIRRLLGTFPPETRNPSLHLLDLACALYAAEEEQLPALLSAALDAGRMPPLLAAAMHSRRLLWHPLRFRGLGSVYRSARRFLEDPQGQPGTERDDKEALEHVKTLQRAQVELEVRRPAPVLEPPEETERTGAPDRLRALGEEAETTRSRLEAAWGRLKQLAAAAAEGRLVEDGAEEAREIGGLVENAKDLSVQGLDELAALRGAGAVDSEETLQQMERVEATLRDLGRQEGRFRKQLGKLSLPEPAVRTADPTGQEPQAGAAPETPAPRQLLERTLREVEGRITDLFARAHATFDAYSPDARALPPIQALRLSLWAREAEARYRLGHRRQARRLWVELLSEDRLNMAAYKNLAVCDTTGPELGRELASWRAYLEILYFYDVVAGDPSRRARLREECHGQLGNAYVPPCLWIEEKTAEASEVDDVALAELLNNPARVRVFVGHKLLEALNAGLAFTSPTLLLGVARDEGEAARAKARERTLAFLKEVSPFLPERIRNAFTDVAQRHVERAHEACGSAKRLTLKQDPLYPEEESRLLQGLAGVLRLKLRLFSLLRGDEKEPIRKELASRLRSPAFAEELCRLDSIPLDNSRKLLDLVASKLGLDSSEQLGSLMRILRSLVIRAFMAKDEIEKVLPLLLADVETDDRQTDLPRTLIFSFLDTARKKGDGKGHEQVAAAVEGWLGRARARRRTEVPPEDPEQELDEADVEKVADELDQFRVEMALLPAGGLRQEGTDWRAVADALDGLLAQHPGIGRAHFYAMTAWYNLAALAQRSGHQAPESIRCLRKARERAQGVVTHSRDAAEVETARQRLEEIDRLLAPMVE